jgi:LysM repeat protein
MKRLLCLMALANLAFAQIPNGSTLVLPSRPTSPAPTPAVTSPTPADQDEDLRALQNDIKALTLRIEDLERKTTALETKTTAFDGGNYATKDDLKLAEEKNRAAIADESQKVQSAILNEIKAARASTAVKPAAPIPAGNPNLTPTPTPNKLTAPASETEKAAFMKQGVQHTVAAGESLSSIARQYHSSMRAIIVANNLTNPDRLLVGSVLFIPTKE